MGEPLVNRAADALRHAALDLTLHDKRVDDLATVVHDDVLEDLQPERLWVDADVSGVAAGGPSRPRRTVETGRLKSGFLAPLDRSPFPFGAKLRAPSRPASQALPPSVPA